MPSGTIKWYNPAKGFGFITPDDERPDVFIHASSLERSGIGELVCGDRVAYELSTDRRSGRVAATHLRREGSAEEERSFAPAEPAQTNGAVQSGVVETFKPDRGFGFIRPDSGGPDLFVHISELERAGLNQLARGQRVNFQVQRDPKTGKDRATRLALGA
jgi:CspA family cold shock protein